ncbi:DUF6934 family protein [Rudanella paleaurantiibacter]
MPPNGLCRDKYPDAFDYAVGSTRAPIRLYQMGITRLHEEIIQDFEM